jgi:hypothetical protein
MREARSDIQQSGQHQHDEPRDDRVISQWDDFDLSELRLLNSFVGRFSPWNGGINRLIPGETSK